MRLGLVLLLISLPGAAQAVEDRYGPARRPDPAAVNPAVSVGAAPITREPTDYRGRMLTWSGKPAAAVSPADPPAAPAPVAVASRGPEPAPLPTSLYDSPASAFTSPPAQPAAAPPPAASVPPPVAAWPQAAAPTLPPPPGPAAAGGSAYAYSPPRAYSVVREWGGTPDRIPAPPKDAHFSGREVALDPNTLGAAQTPDPPAEEVDEEQPQPRPAKPAAKGARK